MLVFTEKYVNKTCKKIKKLAKKELKKSNYAKTFELLELLANINYLFQIKYVDWDIENSLKDISQIVISNRRDFIPIENRFVFYDYFCAGKVLELQYIRAMISWECEFLYIVEANEWNVPGNVYPEINAYDKAQILEVPSNLSQIDKINLVYNRIVAYKPQKAFLQLAPWDVVAVTTFYALPQIERFQINLTDHAFWIGVGCLDYCIEFRKKGLAVSVEKRDIPHFKLLLQPYYPILNKKEFKGFPNCFSEEKVIILSGGTYYKVYGDSNSYFKILRSILIENPAAIIAYAGSGDEVPFLKFISENGFANRIFLLGHREDINALFEQCDIYLSTVPIGGGLMSQLAAVHGKPILAYASIDNLLNDVEGVVCSNFHAGQRIAFSDFDDFLKEAGKMIEDKAYRECKGKQLKSYMITPSEFNENLFKTIMEKEKSVDNLQYSSVNYDYVKKIYIEQANKYLHNFPFLLARYFRIKTITLFPRVFIYMILYAIKNHKIILQKVFKQKVK